MLTDVSRITTDLARRVAYSEESSRRALASSSDLKAEFRGLAPAIEQHIKTRFDAIEETNAETAKAAAEQRDLQTAALNRLVKLAPSPAVIKMMFALGAILVGAALTLLSKGLTP